MKKIKNTVIPFMSTPPKYTFGWTKTLAVFHITYQNKRKRKIIYKNLDQFTEERTVTG